MELELLDGIDAFAVHGLVDEAEAEALLARAEAEGFSTAPITTARGFVHRPDIRNNTRAMFDAPDQVAPLWARLQPLLAPLLDPLFPVGLNERLRFYRYDPGQYFKPHYDGAYRRPGTRIQSTHTLLLYLNEDFEGGETRLLERGITWTPRARGALLFAHQQRHEGCTVRAGAKIVLRTDVMVDHARFGEGPA